MSELTDRETQVAILRSRGMSIRNVARAMGLSHKTVEVHLRNTYIFLDVHDVASLTRYVVERGLDE
jgi:DNA-binding NarL/FixJ family response regulator